jgi:hypothetical protein
VSNSGSWVGIYTTENRWGGPQFKRTGAVTCKGGGQHSWYRWRPTNASEVDGDDPWLYWHECSIMGCDAKEYAADLPDLHDVLALVLFLDERGAPPNVSVLDRVRGLLQRGGVVDHASSSLMSPATHVLWSGRVLCEDARLHGLPGSWPTGQRWIALNTIESTATPHDRCVTCWDKALDALAELRRKTV